MKRLILLFAGLIFALGGLLGQKTFQPKQEEDNELKGVIYNNELAFDLKLHTNGLAFGVNFGKIRTYYKTRYFHVSVGELKHVKEERSNLDRSSTNGRISRSFVYGKQNNLYVIRGGIGEKRYFSEKARKDGVAIGVRYEVGPALGLLKPYYLEVLSKENVPSPFATTRSIKYSEETADAFLDEWNIFGSSGWSKGLTEIKPAIGGYAQAAVHIDWGAFDEFVKAVEIGVMVDIFFRKIPIMVEVEGVENNPFFFNVFLNLQLGKRS